jgi:hypothetical protein
MRRSSLLSRIQELEQGFDRQDNQHIVFGENRTLIHSSDKNKIYIPSETGKKFEQSDAFVNLVIGPYGSGKTTMCLQRLVKAACNMPYWHNGRRRARALIIRNTSGELYSTTLQSWLSWFSELGDIYKRQKPILTYEHHFNDGKGIVELELLFLALDREDDIRKMKSLEVTFAYINELSEVPQGVLSHLKGRLNGRYPSKQFCSEYYWSGIFADTNPPDTDHWLYKTFELDCPDNYKIFHQPPGLMKDADDNWLQNPKCDNYANLSHNYYTMLAEGQTQDFTKVYCLGEYGSVGFGKKVYPEFNSDTHARETLTAIQGDPIHVGWDGGLTPACVVVQFTPRGQLLVLKEYTADDMGVRTFAENVVLPRIQKDFPYNPKIGLSRADPSGVKRDEIMAEFSFIGELNALGIETIPAITNAIDMRVNAVRYFLNRMVDGQPGFLISKQGCPTLFRGFTKDYVYKRVAVAGEERYRDQPDKNMSSHPHDALQYIALEFASDRIANEKMKKETVNMFNPNFRYL